KTPGFFFFSFFFLTRVNVTPRWDWLSSTLLAFINGYDRRALNAPEQRQQQSALTMAEEDDARIRILQSLRGKICEAKNLGPVSGPNRLKDLCTFCTISLDQEEVFRTKVFDKSIT
ncbi:hypothetical protein XENORESO_008996, partial [Xenotaenia resolanae]